MAAREYRIKGTHILVAVLILVIICIIVWQALYVVPPKVYKYTTGLTAKFKIYDVATYTLIPNDTVSAKAEFYPAGTDPLRPRIFTTKPVAVAAYDPVIGAWTAPLDAGSYVLLIDDVADAFYPEKYSVTVPGTDSEDKEVWLSPSTVNVNSRATLSITPSILAFDGGAYSVPVTNITTDDYDKWLVTYAFIISDADTTSIIKNGRLYLTKITGLTPTTASLDGATVTVSEDADATDDGMTGWFVAFPSDWEVGEIHRLDVYLEEVAEVGGDLALRLTVFEYYDCWRTVLRWWTPDKYEDVDVNPT